MLRVTSAAEARSFTSMTSSSPTSSFGRLGSHVGAPGARPYGIARADDGEDVPLLDAVGGAAVDEHDVVLARAA